MLSLPIYTKTQQLQLTESSESGLYYIMYGMCSEDGMGNKKFIIYVVLQI
jgi:hypothetical protein